MDWDRLLNEQRFCDERYQAEPHRPIYVQDADRITFSAAFRRLANKTQVHPLYENDHLHHRLIHSIETASVGRSLGMTIGHWLEDAHELHAGTKHTIAGTVQAACLAHDIGNPPFGHSGESAIGEWFSAHFDAQHGIFGEMDADKRDEFKEFEGNAQGFRILSRLEMYRNEGGMRLSKGVLAAFSKYPISAPLRRKLGNEEKIGANIYCGRKKFGYFLSESDYFSEIARSTGLIEVSNTSGIFWRRHPLVFLVEAADDICYNILDTEDAYICGDLPPQEVLDLLEAVSGKPNSDKSQTPWSERISYARARAIGGAITACCEAFKDNYNDIMSGEFNDSLLRISQKSKEFERLKINASSRIFTARRKTELEVSGRNAIHSVLSGIEPVYEKLARKNWDSSQLTGYEQQLVRALQLDLRDVTDAYSAFHSMTDFVSGMTDRYAVKTAKMLKGV